MATQVKQTRKARRGWAFDYGSFRRTIRSRMDLEALTFRAAGAQIGISAATLWRIQTHKPDIDTVVQVCQWLRISVDAFVEK